MVDVGDQPQALAGEHRFPALAQQAQGDRADFVGADQEALLAEEDAGPALEPQLAAAAAERFAAEGESSARTITLRQLVEQYPSSRYAERAREALAGSGERTPEALKPSE